MNELRFTTPPAPVQRARLAMARLQRHLAAAIGPLDECTDLTGMAIAFMTLDDLYPAYTPLPPDVPASVDPQADLDEAIQELRVAMAAAARAVEVLRYARTIRDLHDLDTVRPSPLNTDSAADPAGW